MPSRAEKYRGATVQDLEPPSALSLQPSTLISSALLTAFERDYTHLTVISPGSRALLGYLSIPRLRALLEAGEVREDDPVERAMLRFERGGKKARPAREGPGGAGEDSAGNKKRDGAEQGGGGSTYRVITPDTPLAELEAFFEGEGDGAGTGRGSDFAVVTDQARRFVLGVATREDLAEFVKRRPVVA